MKKYLPLIIFAAVVVFFFRSFFLQNLLPIPADDIIGLYHPFRDVYAKNYPHGVPYKNSLITDPIRQQYPWRSLVIDLEKKFQLPLWNPYVFSGQPLLGNFQSAPFYPLNIIFFVLPFSFAWSSYIFLGPLLGGIFLYLYLKHFRLSSPAALMGAIVISFSGFFVAWLEWGILVHTLIWLPLILLSMDKMVFLFTNEKISNVPLKGIPRRDKFQMSNNNKLSAQKDPEAGKVKSHYQWLIILIFALSSSFFAGHLQTFFYVFVVVLAYAIARFIQLGVTKRILLLFVLCFFIFLILTAIQWIPLIQFISLSARNVDQMNWHQEGWFVPWQHAIQFIAPDFFGNPATLNYWGVWNYGEFIGYVGLAPLLMGIYAMFFRHDRKTLFFGTLFFLSLLFTFPTIFAMLPFIVKIPFLSTSQPTRLLAISDFSLAVLAAFGLDFFLKNKKKIIYPLIFLLCIFAGMWISVSLSNFIKGYSSPILPENLSIAKHNLLLPTGIFAVVCIVIILSLFIKKTFIFAGILIIVTLFDLFRFADKFTPFTPSAYLYPPTKTVAYLQSHAGINRVMESDKRILPPNFSTVYHLQSVDGYDPLYVLSYGEFIAASERGKPDISVPFGFNRIITPENYNSRLMNLLGVRYILSFDEIHNTNYTKVFQEGQTRTYENSQVLPRIFFVQRLLPTATKQETIAKLFDQNINIFTNAIIDEQPQTVDIQRMFSIGKIQNITYTENTITFDTNNSGDGFLLLTDVYYPSWHASIDGLETKIYKTDYTFRGIFIPKGTHHVIFYDVLF